MNWKKKKKMELRENKSVHNTETKFLKNGNANERSPFYIHPYAILKLSRTPIQCTSKLCIIQIHKRWGNHSPQTSD